MDIKKAEESLVAIQWITNSQKFNEDQLIKLGDAISDFHDCIEELKKLKSSVEPSE